MICVTRRALLAGAATVLGEAGFGKPARAGDDGAPHVDMRPFSDIVRTTPPQRVPATRFATLDGQAKTLGDFAGRAVVLNFWATWCVPCVAELPELDQLAASDPAVAVLAVSTDRGGAAIVKPFVAAHGLSHATILLDTQSDAAHALGVVGFPTTLLIDAQGFLRGTLEGPAAWGNGADAIANYVKK